ncbi:MAG: SurA N-terminal domain-containing protein [Candidatus Eisenbacteria bacterium]|nr:SurA N-terminal domain-containing protein [Candidatus Eisenbacteria bacterium]
MLRFLRSGNKHTKTIWWVLIIVTVVTFIGGFVLLFGMGLDAAGGARMRGEVGVVNGEAITRADWQNALADQRAAYERRLGAEPVERDEKAIESQAWQTLLTQRLLGQLARELGLKAHDREVLLSLQTQPPAALAASTDFQTAGKFDPAKYQAALQNPNNNWSAFEAVIRAQLPVRKLEERLLASIKLSQPELQEAFRDRFERVTATVIAVPPDVQAKVPPPTPAEIDREYREQRGRFTSGPRVELEVLSVPKKYTPEDVRNARQLAQSLVDRARKGEDFAQLARDFSEGPGREQGGAINRVFQPAEFGPVLGQHMAALQPDGVSDPYEENGRFIILKLLERVPDPVSSTPSMRVAQIVIRVHANEGTLTEQYETLKKLRDRAAGLRSLGKAALEKGLPTSRTGWFDTVNQPQALAGVPEATEWGLGGKLHAVSPVFEGSDAFAIVEVAGRHEGGPMPKEQIGEMLHQLAELDARVKLAKPKADQIAQALAQGRSLEDAARTAGLQAVVVRDMTRAQPDPRLETAPEAAGAAFGAPVGRVVGPIRAMTGWYFVRVDQRVAPPDTLLNQQLRGQISTEILTRRQQAFFAGWVGALRMKAKVQDLRYEYQR